MIQMHMQGRYNGLVMLVLHPGQLLAQHPDMVVVKQDGMTLVADSPHVFEELHRHHQHEHEQAEEAAS